MINHYVKRVWKRGAQALRMICGSPKIRNTCWVPITRTTVFGGLYWVSLRLGNYLHIQMGEGGFASELCETSSLELIAITSVLHAVTLYSRHQY